MSVHAGATTSGSDQDQIGERGRATKEIATSGIIEREREREREK